MFGNFYYLRKKSIWKFRELKNFFKLYLLNGKEFDSIAKIMDRTSFEIRMLYDIIYKPYSLFM